MTFATDLKMLRDAKASNGGGVWQDAYPKETVHRLLMEGHIVEKKGHVPTTRGHLMVITRSGRALLDKPREKDLHVAVPQAQWMH